MLAHIQSSKNYAIFMYVLGLVIKHFFTYIVIIRFYVYLYIDNTYIYIFFC